MHCEHAPGKSTTAAFGDEEITLNLTYCCVVPVLQLPCSAYFLVFFEKSE